MVEGGESGDDRERLRSEELAQARAKGCVLLFASSMRQERTKLSGVMRLAVAGVPYGIH